jgi:DNA polymerase III alpha subunit
MRFVHLHTHSHYSLGKGLASPSDLARAAAERGMPALALTDQDSLAGMPEFVQACAAAGVRPIIGAEITLCDTQNDGKKSTKHITALVESEGGYRNLARLLNAGRRASGLGETPAIPMAEFAAGAKGLVALTGCFSGQLHRLAQSKDVDVALRHLEWLRRAVGRDRVYVEIQQPSNKAEEIANVRLIELADYAEIPLVATCNVYYVDPEDTLGDFALLRLNQAATDADWVQWLSKGRRRHFAGIEEISERFGFRSDLMENSLKIAEVCKFQAPSAAQHFPVHALPHAGDYHSALWERVMEGLVRNPLEAEDSGIKRRLDREMAAIRTGELAPYLLLLASFAEDLDRAGILRGPASGIWQSSVVAYALGLSALNPAVYHLGEADWLALKESFPLYRFDLAEGDIGRAREVFLKRVGHNRAHRVGKYALWRRPAALRELGKWSGASNKKVERLLGERQRPDRRPGASSPNGAVDETLKIDDAAFLRRAADILSDRPLRLRPDGQTFVFSGIDLEDAVPLAKLADGETVTQMDSASLDALGMPCVNLAVRPLMSVISMAVNAIRAQAFPNFSLAAIGLNDPQTYELLGQGRTNGIAELHSIGVKALLRVSRPRTLVDLAALLRPQRAGASEASVDMTGALPAALAAYWAAWLKTRFPVEFMAAMLSVSVGQPQRFAILLRETKRLRIMVLPPDINFSQFHFSPEKGAIRTGLSVVRQLGRRAFDELDEERRARHFDDLVDLCRRMDARVLNHRTLSNLIKVGALDRFDMPRSHHLAMLDEIFRDVKAERNQEEEQGQMTLFNLDELEYKRPGDDVRLDEVPEFPLAKLLEMEQEGAGYTLSADPFDFYQRLTKMLNANGPFDLRRRDVDREVFVAGYVDHVEIADTPQSRKLCATVGDDETIALLDCEGAVVRAPRGSRSYVGKALQCQGPALLGGLARRKDGEIYLEVHAIYSMEDIYRLSRRVRRVILNAAGADKRTLRAIVSLLKRFRGDSEIVVSCGAGPMPPGASKLDGMRIFFCPPVYLSLIQILPAESVRLEDSEGQAVDMPAPGILQDPDDS